MHKQSELMWKTSEENKNFSADKNCWKLIWDFSLLTMRSLTLHSVRSHCMKAVTSLIRILGVSSAGGLLIFHEISFRSVRAHEICKLQSDCWLRQTTTDSAAVRDQEETRKARKIRKSLEYSHTWSEIHNSKRNVHSWIACGWQGLWL